MARAKIAKRAGKARKARYDERGFPPCLAHLARPAGIARDKPEGGEVRRVYLARGFVLYILFPEQDKLNKPNKPDEPDSRHASGHDSWQRSFSWHPEDWIDTTCFEKQPVQNSN